MICPNNQETNPPAVLPVAQILTPAAPALLLFLALWLAMVATSCSSWRRADPEPVPMPTTAEAAEAQATVETARTEAATQADTARNLDRFKLWCLCAGVAGLVAVGVGMAWTIGALIRLGGVIAAAAAAGHGVALAEQWYGRYMALGVVVMLLCAVLVVLAISWRTRGKAIWQIVTNAEDVKAKYLFESAWGSARRNGDLAHPQTTETERIVDRARRKYQKEKTKPKTGERTGLALSILGPRENTGPR